MGDLGRRVRARRIALGLDRDVVAARARMDPGYLDYLEHAPARPDAAALLRLARALHTSVEDLLGSERDRAPGTCGAGEDLRLEELPEAECWALLGERGVGRVALDARGRLGVHLVNYAVASGVVLARTAPGTALAEAAALGAAVALEVDRLDEVRSEGWSVLVRGTARPLGEADRQHLGRDVTPWSGEGRSVLVVLAPDGISGLRITAA